MISNRIRFSGMASGMDTDSIVKDMMRPQQYKIDTQKKDQALLQLKQDAWKDMNKKLYNFHTKFAHEMSLSRNFNKTIVSNSNSDVLEVLGDTTVIEGTHTINKVSQLATGAQITGEELRMPPEGTELVGKIAGKETKLYELNLSGPGIGVGNKNTFTVKDPKGESKSITISGETTIGDLEKQLSAAMGGSNVRYDDKFGRFFISTKETGKSKKMEFIGQTGILGKLGITNKEGQNAIIEYNGATIKSETNKFAINGMTINLKATSEVPVQISSQRDPDAMYTFVKEFITEYNKLIDDINEKIGTKPGKDIKPLTAEERKSMSESEIKLWEDKLNSSLFYKDEQLSDFTRVSRTILGGVYKTGKPIKEGEPGQELLYTTLSSLGIVTGSWQEGGKLHIKGDDDDPLYAGGANKLKDAIAENPDEVAAFFAKLGDELYQTHNKSIQSSELKTAFNFYNDKTMTKKMKDYDKTIASLEERMYKMEEMQYKKFAAMEKMLSTLNNQGSWLSQQFGG